MPGLKKIYLVSYTQDILEVISHDILKRHASSLPDLHHLTVFLSNNLAQEPLRKKLMQHAAKHGCSAILPPKITTLRKWAFEQYPPETPLLSQYAKELVLVNETFSLKVLKPEAVLTQSSRHASATAERLPTTTRP